MNHMPQPAAMNKSEKFFKNLNPVSAGRWLSKDQAG